MENEKGVDNARDLDAGSNLQDLYVHRPRECYQAHILRLSEDIAFVGAALHVIASSVGWTVLD